MERPGDPPEATMQQNTETIVALPITHLEPRAILEALLFAHGDPLPLKQLAGLIAMSDGITEQLLDVMAKEYAANPGSGLLLLSHAGEWQLATKPELALLLADFLPKQEAYRITPAMLETLAIIACRQPLSRQDLETLRGVNSDHIMRKLLLLELIEECGQRGRQALYSTTQRFLHHFGLSTPEDLLQAFDIKLE